MKTLTLHLFDVLENSAKAGASEVRLDFAAIGSTLHIELEDDGPGFPPHLLTNPADPYATTRTERPVGLGLALLRQAAEETGGAFQAANGKNGGAHLQISVVMSHWDARPLGDPVGLILETAMAWPQLMLTVSVQVEEAPRVQAFNAVQVCEVLEGLPLSHPSVRPILQADLEASFAALVEWADRVRDQLFTDSTPH
ncbi:MAG: ATP-binding protein [bacterium]